MDVEKFFYMTGGHGKTSYGRNSSLQKKASDIVKHITVEAIRDLYLTLMPQSIAIADLGCSSGPNTFSNIKDMVEAVETVSRKIFLPAPEFLVYLSDLPTNDFNTVFKALPEFYKELKKDRNGPSIFIAGYPGSFYGRLFPNSWLHFVHSSYSLHWLSKVPPGIYNEQGESINKGNIYISDSSPPEVSQAYSRQFEQDFSLFLRSRSQELIVGGRMVLIFLGRKCKSHIDRGNSFFWELLTRSFRILISKGEVEEEKVDSYDVHFYAPSKEEIEGEVRKDGSFELNKLEMFEIASEDDNKNGESYGSEVAMAARAIQQSMIAHHFGEGILDSLFEIYGKLVDEEMSKQKIDPIAFVLVLRKI